MANPDFSGICFLNLNVELLLELSRLYLRYSTYSEASCVKCKQLSLCGNNSLIWSRVLRSCPLPSTLSECCSVVFYHGLFLWRCWRPTCRFLTLAAWMPEWGEW